MIPRRPKSCPKIILVRNAYSECKKDTCLKIWRAESTGPLPIVFSELVQRWRGDISEVATAIKFNNKTKIEKSSGSSLSHRPLSVAEIFRQARLYVEC